MTTLIKIFKIFQMVTVRNMMTFRENEDLNPVWFWRTLLVLTHYVLMTNICTRKRRYDIIRCMYKFKPFQLRYSPTFRLRGCCHLCSGKMEGNCKSAISTAITYCLRQGTLFFIAGYLSVCFSNIIQNLTIIFPWNFQGRISGFTSRLLVVGQWRGALMLSLICARINDIE